MKKFSRKLFLFIALFISLQAFAQTDPTPYEYYDDVIIENGEVIGPDYDVDSEPAWITTIDSKEWKIDNPKSVATNPNPGQTSFYFGAGTYGEGNASSANAPWGTVSSPNFAVDKTLILDLDFTQANNAGFKNEPEIIFDMTYKDAGDNTQTATVTIKIILKPQHGQGYYTVTPAWASQSVICEHTEGTGKFKFTVPFPADYSYDGHVKMSLRATGGLEVGTSSSGSNKIDVYGDNLVLRDDWDNAERLKRNAGKKMKKVTIVRPYTQGWYTLSLPFDLTMKQFQRRFMADFNKEPKGEELWANTYTWKEDSCAEIWEYTSFNDDRKTMQFTKNYSYEPINSTTADRDDKVLKAGVPYLIYIPKNIAGTLYDFTRPGLDPDSEDFNKNDSVMVFTNITLALEDVLNESTRTVEIEPGSGYKFVSNLSKTDLSTVIANNQIYYLSTDAAGENPELKKPNTAASTNIKGFRAYFVSPKASASGEAKPFLSFMNEVPNSIGAVETQFTTDERVYNMQGQYVGKSLNDLPRGIYVVNHKKYVIK